MVYFLVQNKFSGVVGRDMIDQLEKEKTGWHPRIVL